MLSACFAIELLSSGFFVFFEILAYTLLAQYFC